MPAYSFKERFVPKIQSGEKLHTIRSKRKHQAKPGQTVYLYYGMRTKWCKKIGEGVCTKVDDIRITSKSIFINNKRLSTKEAEKLAKADGFDSLEVMKRFWNQTHSLPFSGDIIHWVNSIPL